MRTSLVFAAAVAVGAAGATAGAFLGRQRLLGAWSGNDDPLEGVIPTFPAGDVRVVTTDDGAGIHTITAGTGPTIVFVHGLTGNHDDWGPIARRLLDDGFQVMAIDQRGHGGSTVGDDGFGIPRQAKDLAAVFAQLDLRQVTLVGHSMGGMAAMQLVVDHPMLAETQVAALALVATSPSMTGRRKTASLRAGSRPLPQRLAGMVERARLGAGITVFGEEPSMFMIEQALASGQRCPDHVRAAATAGLIGYHLTDRLSSVTQPTLVVCGTRDQLTPLVESVAIADHIDGARLEVLQGAGHMIIWERAQRLAELIAGLARLPHDPGRPPVGGVTTTR